MKNTPRTIVPKTYSKTTVSIGYLCAPGFSAADKLVMLYTQFPDSPSFIRKWSWLELGILLNEEPETLRMTRRRLVKAGRLEVFTRGRDEGYRVPVGHLTDEQVQVLNAHAGKYVRYVRDEAARAMEIGREKIEKLPDIYLWVQKSQDGKDLPEWWTDLPGTTAWDDPNTWSFWGRLPALVAKSKALPGGTPDERMQAALEAVSTGIRRLSLDALAGIRDGRRYVSHAIDRLLGKDAWKVPPMEDILEWRRHAAEQGFDNLRSSARQALEDDPDGESAEEPASEDDTTETLDLDEA